MMSCDRLPLAASRWRPPLQFSVVLVVAVVVVVDVVLCCSRRCSRRRRRCRHCRLILFHWPSAALMTFS